MSALFVYLWDGRKKKRKANLGIQLRKSGGEREETRGEGSIIESVWMKSERMLGCREQASKASKGVRRGSFLSSLLSALHTVICCDQRIGLGQRNGWAWWYGAFSTFHIPLSKCSWVFSLPLALFLFLPSITPSCLLLFLRTLSFALWLSPHAHLAPLFVQLSCMGLSLFLLCFLFCPENVAFRSTVLSMIVVRGNNWTHQQRLMQALFSIGPDLQKCPSEALPTLLKHLHSMVLGKGTVDHGRNKKWMEDTVLHS